MSLVLKAPAKINLYLAVVGKRPDNYHLIESIFHTVSLYDELEIEISQKSGEFNLSVCGEYAHLLEGDSSPNILQRVYEHFYQNGLFTQGLSVTLHKNIPIGAGLGGGSSDAAALIKLLNSELDEGQQMDDDQLMRLAVKFGADLPFFIRGGMAYCGGIGDEIEYSERTLNWYALLFYPQIAVSTGEAYKALKRENYRNTRKNIVKNEFFYENTQEILEKMRNIYYNSFMDVVERISCNFKNIKAQAENALGRKLMMSGSGSTLYALYAGKAEAESAGAILKKLFNKGIYTAKLI